MQMGDISGVAETSAQAGFFARWCTIPRNGQII